MRLFIAEKPSMAAEIAKCLAESPNPNKKDGYYEIGDTKVAWSYGHILQQANPADYNAKYEKWNAADLPIFPDIWKLNVSPSGAKQFEIIKKLISEATEIINAGDPDREGQLLIDEILIYVKCHKPVKRLLLNALDEKSIKKALNNIKDNKDFYNLQQSALARSRADWLIGMNLSRAYTIAAQQAGHEGALAIGRVKTPTLSLVVRREEEIKNFKPVNYYIIKGSFRHQNGIFETTWQPKDTQAGLDSENRLVDRNVAEELIKLFRAEKNSPVVTACEKSQKKEANRLPYSLSALQIEAGKKFGYTPQMVLDIAQKLYESKLTTYPRSDCDYLPENQFEDAAIILENLKSFEHKDIKDWAAHTDLSLKSRAWNDKKITAHHAIIPTCQVCDYNKLAEPEQNIYYLIAQAYISQFYPVHIFDFSKITIDFSNEIFTASGRVVVVDGWKALYKKGSDEESVDGKEDGNAELPVVKERDLLEYMAGYIQDKTTKPSARFNSSTLLQAMKEIYKYVKNQELKKQLKDVSGIGTEATRASIIKEIIDKGFLKEEKKHLIPTDKAYLMVSLLPDELTYPDSTAIWEQTFEKMLDGNVILSEFLNQQKDFVSTLCQKAITTKVKQAPGITCPTCRQGILRSRNGTKGAFWACNRWPECKTTFNDEKGKPQMTAKGKPQATVKTRRV